MSPPEGFHFGVVDEDDALNLPAVTGFNVAVIHDRNHPYQTDLAMLARKNGEIAGIAGASKTCARLWQIGVEVSPEYRRLGLAAYLVNRLTVDVLARGDVPSYDAIASNLASQRVAHRAGYCIAWVSDWRCDFEGLEKVADGGA